MWASETGGRSGRGQMLDLSVSGARLQVGQTLGVNDVLSIVCGRLPSLPGRARVKWCRPHPKTANAFLCGIAFEERAIDSRRWNAQALANIA